MKKKMSRNITTRWLEDRLVRHIKWKITIIQFWMHQKYQKTKSNTSREAKKF